MTRKRGRRASKVPKPQVWLDCNAHPSPKPKGLKSVFKALKAAAEEAAQPREPIEENPLVVEGKCPAFEAALKAIQTFIGDKRKIQNGGIIFLPHTMPHAQTFHDLWVGKTGPISFEMPFLPVPSWEVLDLKNLPPKQLLGKSGTRGTLLAKMQAAGIPDNAKEIVLALQEASQVYLRLGEDATYRALYPLAAHMHDLKKPVLVLPTFNGAKQEEAEAFRRLVNSRQLGIVLLNPPEIREEPVNALRLNPHAKARYYKAEISDGLVCGARPVFQRLQLWKGIVHLKDLTNFIQRSSNAKRFSESEHLLIRELQTKAVRLIDAATNHTPKQLKQALNQLLVTCCGVRVGRKCLSPAVVELILPVPKNATAKGLITHHAKDVRLKLSFA